MAQTILANMRSNIVLGGSRLGDETLDQMSRSLGEIEGEVERKESDPQKPRLSVNAATLKLFVP